MYDDPGLFLDALLIVAVGSALGYVLVTEWWRAWQVRRMSAATFFAGLSVLSMLWFFAWMLSAGRVPFGLWALTAAGALLVPAFTIGRTRQ